MINLIQCCFSWKKYKYIQIGHRVVKVRVWPIVHKKMSILNFMSVYDFLGCILDYFPRSLVYSRQTTEKVIAGHVVIGWNQLYKANQM